MIETTLFEQFAEAVGGVFIKLRKEKGYTSYESFAFDHEFPRAQYWRVETGRHNLTMRTIVKLLVIHKLTLEAFLVLLVDETKMPYRRVDVALNHPITIREE